MSFHKINYNKNLQSVTVVNLRIPSEILIDAITQNSPSSLKTIRNKMQRKVGFGTSCLICDMIDSRSL